LPCGPSESGSWWFAGSRESYATFGLFAFGEGCPPQGRHTTLLSRVIEPTSAFGVACFCRCLELLDLTFVTYLSSWSDCGNTFRAYRFVGSSCLIPIEKYKIEKTSMSFGAEHHMKARCDASFGRLSWWRKQASLQKVLSTPEDVAAAFRIESDRECRLDPQACPMHVEVFMPCHRKDLKSYTLVASTLPVNIQSCYNYTFRLNDKRRVTIWNASRSCATAVDGRCMLLANVRGAWDTAWHPVVDTTLAAVPSTASEEPPSSREHRAC
jgi:hypothetical protein